jgi:hypothetical protein
VVLGLKGRSGLHRCTASSAGGDDAVTPCFCSLLLFALWLSMLLMLLVYCLDVNAADRHFGCCMGAEHVQGTRN